MNKLLINGTNLPQDSNANPEIDKNVYLAFGRLKLADPTKHCSQWWWLKLNMKHKTI